MNHDPVGLAFQLQTTLIEVEFPIGESTARALRQQVREYAAALKSAGVTPEGAVIDVKCLMRDIGLELTTRTKSTEAVLTPRDLLCGAVVGWCIDGYYSLAACDGSQPDGNTA
jgi:hypothetical protein